MNQFSSPWRSTTTRIVASYGGFFIAWALILVALIYWETARHVSDEAERQLKERAEYFAAMAPDLLQDRIREIYEFDSLHINSYGLFDPGGRPLAGHIVSIPKGLVPDGESHVYRGGGIGPGSTRILGIRLGNGNQLLVARDAGLIDQLHALILRAVFWGLSLTIIPGIAGGILLSVRPLRRIRQIQETSDRIIAGNLGLRLAVAGRGDELDMLSGIVNRMLDEIERLINEVKSVCDNIAHDLRTPLTHLRTRLHRVSQQMQSDDPGAEPVEQALAETDALLTRFSALLRVSELRDEHRKAAFAAVDLVEILEQVRDIYEPVADDKSIQLQLETLWIRSPVRGDRVLLVEAFSNLVSNAIKFTEAGGRVSIRLFEQAQGAVIDIADTGPGIAPQHRQAVFNRFYRIDQSRAMPGFGLGLSIVEAIVHLHDFQVAVVDSAVGACFRVSCWSESAV